VHKNWHKILLFSFKECFKDFECVKVQGLLRQAAIKLRMKWWNKRRSNPISTLIAFKNDIQCNTDGKNTFSFIFIQDL
jgi:hypothetical protein